MNYYEELGLDPSASLEEIRQAYKELARLLHPDRQHENTRRLAECQMKRLNAMLGILTDPDQRRCYDAELAAGRAGGWPASPAVLALVRLGPGLAAFGRRAGSVWLATAVIGLGSILWFFRHSSTGPAEPAQAGALRPFTAESAGAPPPVSGPAARARPSERPGWSRDLTALRRQLESAQAERDRVLARIAALEERGSAPLALSLPASPQRPPPTWASLPPPPRLLTSGEHPPLLPHTAPLSESAPAGLEGTWFYARPRTGPQSGDLYPPEYIEAVIWQEGALLRGRYRARYQVTDRPISPEVFFLFEGTAAGRMAELKWRGGGGSKGELQVRLTSENSMQLSWWATELGSSLGLASGTAVLVRRQEP